MGDGPVGDQISSNETEGITPVDSLVDDQTSGYRGAGIYRVTDNQMFNDRGAEILTGSRPDVKRSRSMTPDLRKRIGISK